MGFGHEPYSITLDGKLSGLFNAMNRHHGGSNMTRFAWPFIGILLINQLSCGGTGPAGGTKDGGAKDGGGTSSADSGTGQQRCVGTATSCALLSGAACSGAQGCSATGGCSGVPLSCPARPCLQLGCYTSGGMCVGSPTPCNTFVIQPTCANQAGCVWSTGCSGTPTPCSSLSAASCSQQPGCSLQ